MNEDVVTESYFAQVLAVRRGMREDELVAALVEAERQKELTK